jgi:hypothetical protein
MANFFNNATKELRLSGHSPDFGAGWTKNPAGLAALVAAGVPSSEWVEAPAGTVREMTAAEKDAGLLGARKLSKIISMKNAVSVYIESKYDLPQQIAILSLYAEGIDKNKNNRKALVQSIVDWMNSVLGEFYTRKNAVLAATTVAAVNAQSHDFTAFDATVPATTVEQIKNTGN